MSPENILEERFLAAEKLSAIDKRINNRLTLIFKAISLTYGSSYCYGWSLKPFSEHTLVDDILPEDISFTISILMQPNTPSSEYFTIIADIHLDDDSYHDPDDPYNSHHAMATMPDGDSFSLFDKFPARWLYDPLPLVKKEIKTARRRYRDNIDKTLSKKISHKEEPPKPNNVDRLSSIINKLSQDDRDFLNNLLHQHK